MTRWKRFGFLIPVVILSTLAAGAVFADWIAPYASDRESRQHSYHPPTKLHFRSPEGAWLFPPAVMGTKSRFDENLRRHYEEDPDTMYRIRFGEGRLVGTDPGGYIYLLGTDARGRDIFSRILYGARISLSIGLFGALLGASLGLVIGSAAGYFGGRVDNFLMRAAEFFMMVPGFYFLLALRASLPPELGSREVYTLIVVILSLIGWGGVARVIRGMVLSLRERDFVKAARILGRTHGEILLDHIFPHTLTYLFVVISISVPSYILMESGLSLLGLGIQEPDVSWGSLLGEAMSISHLSLHPWVLFPGLVIVAAAMSFNALGDALCAEEAQR